MKKYYIPAKSLLIFLSVILIYCDKNEYKQNSIKKQKNKPFDAVSSKNDKTYEEYIISMSCDYMYNYDVFWSRL